MFETEVVRGLDENILNDILFVNRKSFPHDWAYCDAEEYYGEMLGKKDNIHILLKNKEKTIGYLLAIPHNDAVNELKNDDPIMKDDSIKYYIETAAILPDYRGNKGFSRMLDTLVKECNKRGIRKLSLHARVNTGLSLLIQEKFEVRDVRRIEQWRYYNYQEPTDYMEIILPPEKVRSGQNLENINDNKDRK